jgi:hypothetical protein
MTSVTWDLAVEHTCKGKCHSHFKGVEDWRHESSHFKVLKTGGMKAAAGIELFQKSASLPPKDELWVWTEIYQCLGKKCNTRNVVCRKKAHHLLYG